MIFFPTCYTTPGTPCRLLFSRITRAPREFIFIFPPRHFVTGPRQPNTMTITITITIVIIAENLVRGGGVGAVPGRSGGRAEAAGGFFGPNSARAGVFKNSARVDDTARATTQPPPPPACVLLVVLRSCLRENDAVAPLTTCPYHRIIIIRRILRARTDLIAFRLSWGKTIFSYPPTGGISNSQCAVNRT